MVPIIVDKFFHRPSLQGSGDDLKKLDHEVPAINIQETRSKILFDASTSDLK